MNLEQLIDDVLGPPPAKGRRAKPLHASFVRNLNQADIQQLWDLPAGGLNSSVRPLVRIRTSHHGLARLLAEGKKHEEAAIITGYSGTYISNLLQSPDFANLVEYYKTQIEGVFINVHERLAALGIDTIEELQHKLATAPESFTTRELMELAALTMDRAGYGPKSTVQHSGAVALVGADAVARIKNEVDSRHRGTTKELYSPSDQRPALGAPVIDGTLVPTSAASRGESEGDGVPAEAGKVLVTVGSG
jgi:hypothetical protein